MISPSAASVVICAASYYEIAVMIDTKYDHSGHEAALGVLSLSRRVLAVPGAELTTTTTEILLESCDRHYISSIETIRATDETPIKLQDSLDR